MSASAREVLLIASATVRVRVYVIIKGVSTELCIITSSVLCKMCDDAITSTNQYSYTHVFVMSTTLIATYDIQSMSVRV